MPSFAIDYFELPASETAASKAFFADAFGFGFKDYGPAYSEITGAGLLGGINADAADRGTAPLIGIRTDDLEAAIGAVEAAGGVITRPAYGFPGGRRFCFREPGGCELLVYCPGE